MVGAAAAGSVLFGLLSMRNPGSAALFLDMVRHGTGALAALPEANQSVARGDIAHAFSGVFLLVAAISCVSVAMSSTMNVRNL